MLKGETKVPKAYPDAGPKPTIDEIAGDKEFVNPETKQKVKLHSLPKEERAKQRKKLKKEISKQLVPASAGKPNLKPTIDEIVDDRKFTNPETGKQVKLHSLPPEERKKQRKKMRKEVNKELKTLVKVASSIVEDLLS